MEKGHFPKIGLALGSGGANGLAHIGVLKILEKNHIPVDFIAGSSIGALIGALYALHGRSGIIKDIAVKMSKKHRLKLLDITLKGGLLKGEKLTEIINEFMNGASFKDLLIPYAAIATDFYSGETVIIDKGDLITAIRASVGVPGLLQPVLSENHVLADGGLSEPIPVAAVRAMGADIVIAVNLDKLPPNSALPQLPALHSIPWQSINILRHHLADESAKSADFIITPESIHNGIIGWNSFFNEQKILDLIEAGEKATEVVIPDIKKSLEEDRKKHTPLGMIASLYRKLLRMDSE